jgi:hypothetical protein
MKSSTENYQLAMDLTGEMMTSSSQEDSHVNPTQVQEKDLGKMTSDISSRRCLESFKRLSQPTLWAKTFMDSLIGTEAWCSKKCVLTWRLLGTQYNRYYCQLRASVRPTTECESGLLPTPMAQAFEQVNTEAYNARMERIIAKGHKPFTMPLDQMAIRGMLPTPIAGDWKGQLRLDGTSNMLSGKASLGMLPTPTAMNRSATVEQTQARQEKYGGTVRGMYLENFAAMGMLPTPLAQIIKHGHSEKYWDNRIGKRQEDLAMWNAKTNGKTSQLNPQFVAEMMGFPTDWTELPFLSGDNNL